MTVWNDERRMTLQSAGLAVLRLFAGLGIAAHGYEKFFGPYGIQGFAGFLNQIGVPAPGLMAWVSGGTELVGGALLVLGLVTRMAAIPLAVNMLVAAVTVHSGSYFITNNPPGMEYTLNLASVFAAVALAGPGRFSADALIFRSRE